MDLIKAINVAPDIMNDNQLELLTKKEALIRQKLNEDMNKSDVKSEIKKYIDSSEFKTKIEKIVKDRIKNEKELTQMESEFGEFRVYFVEVCLGCGWNPLTSSFLLGDGQERKPPRKAKTL